MDRIELIKSVRVVELAVRTRPAAIRALARASGLVGEGIPIDWIVAAIEEREATAQTIVTQGLAMPHAVIDWDGDHRIALGRSRAGIFYGVAGSAPVQLIVLYLIGRQRKEESHLELLAVLAELLEPDDFRRELVQAPDTSAITRLLLARVGEAPEGRLRRAGVPRMNAVLVQQAIDLVHVVSAQALLVALDHPDDLPWELLSRWEGRLLVVASQGISVSIERADTHFFEVPTATLTRIDRTNLGVLLAAAPGLLVGNTDVVCVTGPGGRQLDSLTVTRPESRLVAMFESRATRPSARIRPPVVLRVLSLAIELGAEGREGKPVGTIFVIGDSRQVAQLAQQFVLNPFHGYPGSLRNVLDPSLGETIKEFAQIDGAFVVQADGKVLSAGTFLVPTSSVRLPSGLGTRHRAAAAITADTQAMAITVSHSTGMVTVFRDGQIVLQLERAARSAS